MPNLANYRLLAVFIFHKTGDKVILTEQQNQLLLLIASTLRQRKFDRVTYID
jgi:hypothetical protein